MLVRVSRKRGLINIHLSAAGSPTATMVRLQTSQLARLCSKLRHYYCKSAPINKIGGLT